MLYTKIVNMGNKNIDVKIVAGLEFANINGLNINVKIVAGLYFASMGDENTVVKLVHLKNAFYVNEFLLQIISKVTVDPWFI